jgi:hypothetical protein
VPAETATSCAEVDKVDTHAATADWSAAAGTAISGAGGRATAGDEDARPDEPDDMGVVIVGGEALATAATATGGAIVTGKGTEDGRTIAGEAAIFTGTGSVELLANSRDAASTDGF